jgi:homoserine dehydrogenase
MAAARASASVSHGQKPLRVGIAGLGTVGGGIIRILQKHGDLIADRACRPVKIVAVSARSKTRRRAASISRYKWYKDPVEMAAAPDIDVIVEVIGGAGGVARRVVETALKNGKAVATANKALLAHHGYELAQIAEKNDAALMYEAAVAGGIPIIKTLREGFAGNDIEAVYGILNGTCNYILTAMRETGRDFKDVLRDAQAKGYAEANPATDIEGTDTAHKLCILGSLAFGVRPDMAALPVSGIAHLTADDIAHAEELGYRVKLLGIARRVDGRIVQMVEPCLVPADSTVGAVDGVYNAVLIEGDFVGDSLSVGRGAGEGPTASAVVADLIDYALGFKTPVFGIPTRNMKKAKRFDAGEMVSRFYLHLNVKDRPGVLAQIAAIMRDHDVSIEAVIQQGHNPGKPVSIVMTMHKARRADIEAATAEIGRLPAVTGHPCLMRIESFQET